MRWSKALLYTSKEAPADAQAKSHKLLARAGFIEQIAAGVYTYLPAAWRSMKRAMEIIREEMDAIGGQEILMPALSPASLWQESGRWEAFGDDMFRLKDRKGRDYALAPTHEEVIAELARRHVRSYRDLPQIWYQLETKFRDEPRPRGGLLRVREFIMKDSYSLDASWEGLDEAYEAHGKAYERIFSRCGLPAVRVQASTGLMGGTGSEEFMVEAEAGEDTLVRCSRCGYAANLEVAEGKPRLSKPESPYTKKEKVHTPGVKSAEEVAAFLGVHPSLIIKTLLYYVGEEPWVVLVRGDQEVNPEKLAKALGGRPLLALPEEIEEIFGAEAGFVGPVDIKGKVAGVIADYTVRTVERGVVGANERDYHIVGVTPEVDFKVTKWADIRSVQEGDLCPRCGEPLQVSKAIELGHIFKLGTRYSESMGVYFTDRDGSQKPIIMGSYGIGVGRILAAAAEVFGDERGLRWPKAIAPFDAVVLPVDPKHMPKAEELYNSLREKGLDVVLDDREATPGFKFKDAELVGFPLILVLGRKAERGLLEVQVRMSGERFDVPLEKAPEEVLKAFYERVP